MACSVLRLKVRADFGASSFAFDKSMLGEGTFQTKEARLTLRCGC